MVTFSIGAILTTNKAVAEAAKDSDKFTHTKILYCEHKQQFENKIIEYLDAYYKSVYAREGVINASVDRELRNFSKKSEIVRMLQNSFKNSELNSNLNKRICLDFKNIFSGRQSFYWQ
jgi:hypothetical protein